MKQVYQRTFKNGDICTFSLDTNGEKFAVVAKWKTISGEDQPDWPMIETEYHQWLSETAKDFVATIPQEELESDFGKIAAHFGELLNYIL